MNQEKVDKLNNRMKAILKFFFQPKAAIFYFFGGLGFFIPVSLYAFSDFFGWSAPRGGEAGLAILISIGATLSLSINYLISKKKHPFSQYVTAGLLAFWVGFSAGFVAPITQSKPYWAWGEPPTASELLLVPRVAHAGGAVSGLTYTNSLEALEFNKDRFDLFEVDLIMLGDGSVVCLHDFDASAIEYLGKKISAETEISEFLRLRNSVQGKVTPCTLEELEEWLIQNPTKKIVTDTKNSTLSILNRVSMGLPNAKNRFIPQIYQLDEYEPVERLGFEDIIFTTYRFSQLNQELINFVKDANLFAVTITSTQVPALAESITKLGVPIYVHTVNDLFWYDRVRSWGISNIYTDFLNATIDGY